MQHLTKAWDIMGVAWDKFAVFAAGIALVVAAAANIGKIAKAAKAFFVRWKERREAPVKALKAIQDFQEKQDLVNKDQQKQLDEIKEALAGVDEQVATVQREKMSWAYSYYRSGKKGISQISRTSLCDMYDQYTGKHNHIPEDFKKVILAAPEDND